MLVTMRNRGGGDFINASGQGVDAVGDFGFQIWVVDGG